MLEEKHYHKYDRVKDILTRLEALEDITGINHKTFKEQKEHLKLLKSYLKNNKNSSEKDPLENIDINIWGGSNDISVMSENSI